MSSKISDVLAYSGLVAILTGWIYYTVAEWNWISQTFVSGGVVLLVAYVATNFSSLRAAMKTRGVRYGSAAGATILLVVGILASVNFLNFRHHHRIDMTEAQLYSISDQSRRVVDNLELDIEVVGFFRAEGPRISFEDLMREYRYVSSRLTHRVVDPEEDPGTAAQYEITREGQVVVAGGGRTEMVEDFDEGKITNAIIKVTREEEKTVYFLEGHGERDLNDTGAEGFSMAREAIERQNYQVGTYNLAQQNQLPTDATVIVSAGPKVNLFPNEEKLLNEFLAQGGKFLLMVDPQTDFEMNSFLTAYGLGLGQKVVIDASGLGQLFGLGAAAPMVADYTSHPLTQELGRTMTFFPLAQNVTIGESTLGYTPLGLAKTSERSWAESDLGGGQAAFDEGQDVGGPLELVAVATRTVEPAETPENTNGEEGGSGEQGEETGTESARESRLVLYGDSDFAANAYFDGGVNGDLLLMTVSWLAEETDLIAVRARDPENRRIEVTFAQSRLIFWGVVILLPLATLVLGMTVWQRRR